MKKFSSLTVRTLAVLMFVTALLFAIAILPGALHSSAETEAASATVQIDRSEHGFPNFDIRTQNSTESRDQLARFRSSVGKDDSFVAGSRNEMTRGEDALRNRLPDVVFEHSDRLGNAEVISPDVWKDGSELLTQPSSGDRPTVLRNFLKENSALAGIDPSQADSLTLTANYTNGRWRN